eukprot:99503-Amphidinium_carterae.1
MLTNGPPQSPSQLVQSACLGPLVNGAHLLSVAACVGLILSVCRNFGSGAARDGGTVGSNVSGCRTLAPFPSLPTRACLSLRYVLSAWRPLSWGHCHRMLELLRIHVLMLLQCRGRLSPALKQRTRARDAAAQADHCLARSCFLL